MEQTPPPKNQSPIIISREIMSEFLSSNRLLSLLREKLSDDMIKENDWIFRILESSVVLFLNYQTRMKLYRATGEFDRMGIVGDLTTFVVFVTGKSVTRHMCEQYTVIKARVEAFCDELDSADFSTDEEDVDNDVVFQSGVEDAIHGVRSKLEMYQSFRSSKFFKKFYKLFLYCLSFGIFDRFGMTFDKAGYDVFEAEAVKKKHQSQTDFVYIALDALTYLLSKGVQIIKLGRVDPILHSAQAYSEWHDRCTDLKIKSTLLSNPEAHGFTEPSFREDLDKAIEQGEAIVRLATDMESVERRLFRKLVNDLKLLSCELTTRSAAREGRKPPFSVLISGPSGIGKSSIKDLIHCHFAKVEGLDITPSQTYTRNPADDFWSGYTTSVWAIFMDDVAFRHPGKAPNGDSSVDEFLQVINAVPFTPNQADLADKGRTPVRAKLVVATTNVENLNAHYYFACPVAAQRRFPYILVPTVKDEYLSPTGMLDSSKATTPVGEYPNFWNWTIKRVMVEPTPRGIPAKTEIVFTTSDVYEVTDWLTEAIKNFKDDQDKTYDAVAQMRDISLCSNCSRPEAVCNCPCLVCGESTCSCSQQSLALGFGFAFLAWICNYFAFLQWFVYCKTTFWLWFVAAFTEIQVMMVAWGAPIWMFRRVNTIKALVRRQGERVQASFTNRNLVRGCAILSAIYTVYQVYSNVKKIRKAEKEKEQTCTVHFKFQNDTEGSRPTPMEKERENVWFNNNIELSNFDLTSESKSSKAWTDSQVIQFFTDNTLLALVPDHKARQNHVVIFQCYEGNIYFTNNHSVPTFLEDMTLTLSTKLIKSGVTENMTIRVSQQDFIRKPDRDLCFIVLKGLPPRKGIKKFLLRERPSKISNNGFIIGKTRDGDNFSLEARCIKDHFNCLSRLNKDYSRDFTYACVPARPTQDGECGSGLVARTDMGVIFLGIHTAAARDFQRSIAAPVLASDFEDLAFHDLYKVQSGEPQLSAPSAELTIQPLHHKSVFRYIEVGSCAIYGTLRSFRAKPRSHVGDTIMAPFLKERGYVQKYTAPVMRGWKPWRIAALDMVKPIWNFKSDILEECEKHFFLDILKNLDADDYKMLEVYDDFTAINGAAGVAYVDRMKRTTSAGNPWKKSKRHFMEPLPPEGELQDPITFTDEIMDRVERIQEVYAKGERAYPNFCAHLKDEAVSFSKAERGKTRVFTGAPVDWSIVMRKYYLSTVRLIQNRRFAFEAAPGTVAQSHEWSEMYEYITKYGSNKIVAGDYKSFDKRMPPAFILSAFNILIKLCARSKNFTKKQLKVMRGIAVDTAYPLVDYNGDLVNFYGSNPSGHPLTVIINCLVNSLYMRYAYYVLHPAHKVYSFRNHVSLMTYGDDNIMSVSDKAPWYNHTTISKAFAEMGIEYTMPDKESESVPYIDIKAATFLKRSWRFDEDVGAYMAVLDHDSIEKMLLTWVRSKSICAEEQAVAVISSAIREYFYYGKSTFEKRRLLFKELITHLELDPWIEDWVLPTWDELVTLFWDTSQRLGSVPDHCQPAFPITSGD